MPDWCDNQTTVTVSDDKTESPACGAANPCDSHDEEPIPETEPRVYVPYPNVAVIYFDDIQCKADLYWDEDRVVLKTPFPGKRKMERRLSEYDEYEGNMRAWILSLRDADSVEPEALPTAA